MDKQKISVKKVLEYKDAVSYIEDLARSFRSGTIVVESGGEHVVMTPGAQVAVKVEAKVKNDKQKIGFELSWTEAGGDELRIGDAEPAPAPAIQPEGGAPAMKPAAQAPAAKIPAMAPATTEPARVPATTEARPESEAKSEAKFEAKKAAAKKDPDGKKAAKKAASKKSIAKKTSAKSADKK
ncbi:hypothetical protein DND132_2924 [Pseudodesulfovibrio mercurii]|uniref:Amphi-Trp domain-containing protein n=1 Tax=Pseudodesulfovibrio mercurii TaxID=641491 RepID=F0JJM8_9BACT|nr:amphi-Trp domain-containing protein [Pseudodesulfovibrio mercurii]EGB16127.1 hypothetical protein DND132_2924 [Pseudodesulfovibrio mercurii]